VDRQNGRIQHVNARGMRCRIRSFRLFSLEDHRIPSSIAQAACLAHKG
jgi:hypothetical protein